MDRDVIPSTDGAASPIPGLSPALADLLLDALREHDAAGRPPIKLPSAEDVLRAPLGVGEAEAGADG